MIEQQPPPLLATTVPTARNDKDNDNDDDSINTNENDAKNANLHLRAKEVVRKIRTLIDTLRLIPAFSSYTTSDTKITTTTSSSSAEDDMEVLSRVDLYSILSQALELDIDIDVDAGIDVHVQGRCGDSTASASSAVVEDILMPLCRELYLVYQTLDCDEHEPPQHDTNHKNNTPSAVNNKYTLLSLQDYTNIACLLELLVCTSILPRAASATQTHTKSTTVIYNTYNTYNTALVRERVKHNLSKALAGRIPRRALLWGSACLSLCNDKYEHGHEKKKVRIAQEMRSTAHVIADLCLLDRFRPMLLPRHLEDVYLGLLYANDYDNDYDNNNGPVHVVKKDEREAMLFGLLPIGTSNSGKKDHHHHPYMVAIDARSAAVALQSLLSRGTTSIVVKGRAGRILSQLAVRDLPAILDVFVSAAADSSITITKSAAASRLAMALVASSCSSTTAANDDGTTCIQQQHGCVYWSDICNQLLLTLDCCEISDAAQSTGPLTAAALFPLLPPGVSQTCIIAKLLVPLISVPSPDVNVARSVRRICVMLCAAPSSKHFIRLLLKAGHDRMSLSTSSSKEICGVPQLFCQTLGIFFRIAASAPVSAVKSEALLASAIILQQVPPKFGAINLVRSLCTTDCDRSGIHFRPSASGGCELCSASNGDNTDEESASLSKRITVAIEVIKAVADGTRSLEKECINDDLRKPTSINSNAEEDDSTLASELFQLLLSSYLSSLSNYHDDRALPAFLSEQTGQMAALSLLPFLCEECKAEDLIGQGNRVLLMIKTILSYSNGDEYNHGNKSIIESDQKEALQSTASLCLSLLVVILELGKQERSADQEVLLKSFLPILQMMAEIKEMDDSSASISLLKTEMAEMAAHACALIISRGAPLENVKCRRKSVSERIAAIESDLMSSTVPIRARGAVLLQHLARATTIAHDRALEDQRIHRNRPIIEDISNKNGQQYESSTLIDTKSSTEIEKLLHVAIKALDDDESYVFLAGVQAVSALGDACPGMIIPPLAISLSRGYTPCEEGGNIVLTLSQRVKVAEALIFVIRRRGNAIGQHARNLMQELLVGVSAGAKVDVGYQQRLFQATHSFFDRGYASVHENAPEEGSLPDEHSGTCAGEEQMLRINTGGPLFVEEENSAVIAGCISCLTEVLAVVAPSFIVSVLPVLASLCIDALRLECTRPIRRASALLGRTFYERILQEAKESTEEKGMPVSSVAMSLLSYDNSLKLALEQNTGDDAFEQYGTNQESSNRVHLSNKITRLYDPATSARCKEALYARKEAEEMSVFATASFISQNEKGQDSLPDMLNIIVNNSKSQDILVDAMEKFKITTNGIMITFWMPFIARPIVLLTFLLASTLSNDVADMTASYLKGIELSCEGSLDQAKDLFLTIRETSDYYAASLHCLGNIAAIQADLVLSGTYHGLAKASDPIGHPPLAVMYMEGVECGNIGDIFWTSSFVKKEMFELLANMHQEFNFASGKAFPSILNVPSLDEQSSYTDHETKIFTKSHLSLATQLEDSGFMEYTERHLEKAIVLNPNDLSLKLRTSLMTPVLYDSVGHVEQTRRKLEINLDQLYDHVVEKGLSVESLDYISMPSTYYLVYQGFNDAPVMSKINRLYRTIFPDLSKVLMTPTEKEVYETGRKIRVGFASKYFRNHSVCKLFCGIISGLDRDIFDVIIFSSATVEDSYTKAVSELSDFVRLEGFFLNNRHLALSKKLDIMVYPDIGISDSFLWAHSRLANIQISLWGHPVTSGMSHIDYFISSDIFHDATLSQNQFTEQLVRMDSTSFYFKDPVRGYLNHHTNLSTRYKEQYSFSSIGIPNDSKVFLVPQTLPKLHPAFDTIMHQLLDYSEKFYILIIYNKDKPIWMKRLQKRFAQISPNSDRLKFLPTVSNEDFFEILRSSIALLDPYPFGGGVTSLEAFSICKGVVALPSAQTVPRLTSGMIHKMDDKYIKNALIAMTQDDFVNKLVRLGDDDSFRRNVEDSICERKSLLFDDVSTVLEFEGLLEAFHMAHSL